MPGNRQQLNLLVQASESKDTESEARVRVTGLVDSMIDEASSRSRAASTPSSYHILIREKSRPARRDTTFCIVASPLDLAACPPIHWWVGDDHAWGKLIQLTKGKAAKAGKVVELVDARYTSQKCSQCGIMVPKTLAERTH